MAQKRRSVNKKPNTHKKAATRTGGSGFGRFLLGVLILVGLAYGAFALKEGKLVPDVIRDFSLQKKQTEAPKTELPRPATIEQEPSKSSEPTAVPESVEEEAPFDFEAFDLYFTSAFDFAWPSYSTTDAIIERPYYTLRYSEEHEQAMWVAYKLVADSLARPSFERKDDFREDPRVRTGSASLTDYKGSGFDRGHLAPAADFSYDEFALSQSFYMSNMSPQDPSFNRGVWKKLEDQVRDWAKENQAVYVVTGPVLGKKLKTIGRNEVSVPEYYYKIVLDIEKPEVKAIAFLMKNEKSSAELENFVVSIDELEKLTQLDFFPSMPDELENALEKAITPQKWF